MKSRYARNATKRLKVSRIKRKEKTKKYVCRKRSLKVKIIIAKFKLIQILIFWFFYKIVINTYFDKTFTIITNKRT